MTYILMFNVCVLCVVYVCCRGGSAVMRGWVSLHYGAYVEVVRPPWVSVHSTLFESGSLFVCVTGDCLVLL